MKFLYTILLTLCGYFAIGQIDDTTISKKVLDSLKTEIYVLKTSNKKQAYNNYFISNFYKVDTVLKRKDSIIIDYLAKDGKLIRQEKVAYLDTTSSIKYDSCIVFYNEKGLREYTESFVLGVITFDADDEGQGGEGFVKYKDPEPWVSRVVYDDKSRIILTVLFFDQSYLRVRDYYDRRGNFKNEIKEKIQPYQFWDN